MVHGGNYFSKTTVITDDVKEKIKTLASLAPLHNPPNLEGIEVAEEVFKKAKQVAYLIQRSINLFLNMLINMPFQMNI